MIATQATKRFLATQYGKEIAELLDEREQDGWRECMFALNSLNFGYRDIETQWSKHSGEVPQSTEANSSIHPLLYGVFCGPKLLDKVYGQKDRLYADVTQWIANNIPVDN